MNDVVSKTEGSHHWSTETKELFCSEVVKTGNISATCRELGIPRRTAMEWVKQDWFLALEQELVAEQRKLLKARIKKVRDRGLELMEEVLENGEDRITKSGDIVKLQPSLSALTIAVGTLTDKEFIIEKQPQAVGTTQDILAGIADLLRQAVFKRVEGTVIDVEAVEQTG